MEKPKKPKRPVVKRGVVSFKVGVDPEATPYVDIEREDGVVFVLPFPSWREAEEFVATPPAQAYVVDFDVPGHLEARLVVPGDAGKALCYFGLRRRA